METHEWANQFTRDGDNDMKVLCSIIEKYEALGEVARQLRMVSVLESDTNRRVDDVAVSMSAISSELDSILNRVGDLTFDLQAAVASAWYA